MTSPRVLRSRETLPAELALEQFMGRSFQDLVREAERTRICDESDLVAMGWALFRALLALARGEVAEVSVERRLPFRGEYHPMPGTA